MNTKIVQYLLVILALGLGLTLRLYHLNAPLDDWHSYRQADTAAVSRIYLEQRIDLLHPRYYDLSDVQSGQENPHGWRMVEFPFYNAASAIVSSAGHMPPEISGRIISLAMSLGSSLLIFLILQQTTGIFTVSLFGMLTFLLLPFNIYYSRTVLPEPSAVFFMLLALYLFPKWPLLAAPALAVAILLKPYTGILLFPAFAFYSLKYLRRHTLKHGLILLLTLVMILIPFALWRFWISRYPAGIPASDWLLNDSTKAVFPDWFHGIHLTFLNKLVAFRPYWIQWLFYQRPNLILGAYGLVPLFLGLALRKKNLLALNLAYLFGIFLYFTIVAGGNIQHDYYQVLIVPFLCLLIGPGLYYLSHFMFPAKTVTVFITLLISGLSLYFSWIQISPYYIIDHPEYMTAGEWVNQNTPKDSIIVTPTNGDTTFLYQTHRSGYPVEVYDFAKIKSLNPGHPFYLVSFNNDTYTNNLLKTYPIYYKSDKFVILNLNQ